MPVRRRTARRREAVQPHKKPAGGSPKNLAAEVIVEDILRWNT